MFKQICIYFTLLFSINCSFANNQETHIAMRVKEDGILVAYQNSVLYQRSVVIVKTKDSLKAFPLQWTNETLSADLGKYGRYTESLKFAGNEIRGEVTLNVATDEPFLIHCPLKTQKRGDQPYYMIPGFLYGSNNVKSSHLGEPKLKYGGKPGWPVSSELYARTDRSTHRGVISVNDGFVTACAINETMQGGDSESDNKWQPDYLYTGLFVNTTDNQHDAMGFTLGYENSPKRWVGKVKNYYYDGDYWQRRPDPMVGPSEDEYRFGWIEHMKGRTLNAETYYFADTAAAVTDYRKALRGMYYEIHQAPRKRSSREEALKHQVDAILETIWQDETNSFRLNPRSQQDNTAWTGGTEIAYPLLKAGLKMNNKKVTRIATRYFDDLTGTGLNEQAGMFYEAKIKDEWRHVGWWRFKYNMNKTPRYTGYVNGQASYFLLKAYELTGGRHQQWLEAAQIVLDTALKSQRRDGSYGALFDVETGKAVDYDAIMGCWFVPGMALLSEMTGEDKYLESAKKALKYYHTWHQRGEIYGTPMDVERAVDQEGNLAFIAGCFELHRITSKDWIVDLALDGLAWEWSWKFAYNTRFSNNPLKQMNWSTCGGSITSTHNTSIHQMGNLVAGPVYYFYQQTKDPYIADRLKDLCVWGLGTYNTFYNEFGFGHKGEGTEQFLYTDAFNNASSGRDEAWDGGVWENFLPWATSCVILNCAEDIPDVFFGE